ncbi:MAG: hypothetical protein ACRYFZ_07305 [Janthinobacterium lividum]
MLNPNKTKRKDFDPSAAGKGTAGVLPHIPDADKALVTLDEAMFESMVHEYHNGREKGQTTNNKYLDPYFKWMPGYTNVITGWPGHGKSQLFFELLLLRAAYDGKMSVIWPSENLPAKRFYQGLIHTLTGRPADKSQANCLSLADFKRAKDFIRDHFILLSPPTGMGFSPPHMLAYMERAIAKHGGAEKEKGGIAHCMLDPWNKQDHSAKVKMGGDEGYLMHAVGLCTSWSQDANQCLVLTAHPKRVEDMKFGQTRPVPDGASISGGQIWENMPHYIGAVHRPFKHIPGNTEAAFYSHKCKDERYVAKLGSVGAHGPDGLPPMVPIHWDEVSNRYRWGRERWSPFDDELVRAIYAAPVGAPPPQLFTGNGQPAPPAAEPQGLRTSAAPGAGFEAETRSEAIAPTERFGPRTITSADLPTR